MQIMVSKLRIIAAYFIAPAIIPIAAYLYWTFLSEPCSGCPGPVWAYALPVMLFTYPATFIIATPTIRLLPVSFRSPLSGPPIAGAILSLLVFLMFVVGMHGSLFQILISAGIAAMLGAISGTIFAAIRGSNRSTAFEAERITVRNYLPYLALFLAAEGGAYFGQFSCGGAAVVGEIFGVLLLVITLSSSILGGGFLSTVPLRIGFFFIVQILFALMQAMSAPFYPAPPQSLAEYFSLFVDCLIHGPC
ncbi:hypothetical protein KSF73_04955 [Burkholderiaceae bacterium DAT-1]|nr:hypothetical protein [Burkholderiaceae bacterium DAT-1]